MSQISLNSAKKFLTRLKADTAGQDLVEYALLTGFMVIAVWAFFPTQIVPSMSTIFGKIVSLSAQVGTGS